MGKDKESSLGITAKKSEDFSEWYIQVIQKSEMVDYSPVSGCMVIRPHAYAVWERVKEFFDAEIKKMGVQNAYFPLFIPEKLLKKEQEHVEGFSPEVAWVTHTGDSKLSERLAIRPTSETIMYDSYRKWIRSHNDLPLKINQWCNVVRWEFKHPMPFIRTREFLWQEGHTAFATQKESDEEAMAIVKLYGRVLEEMLAIPALLGKKSDKEKFAGADYTLSAETFLPVGKAIQGATSHFLGRNFARAFDITFLDEKGEKQHPWQNSWGISTRTIGIMAIMHGDDKGLVLPPKVAPIQAVIIPVLFSGKEDINQKILDACKEIAKGLKVRTHLDDRDNYTPGWKYNHWELKGIPLRIEIGPRDIENNSVMIVRRDTGEKQPVKIEKAPETVMKLLDDIQTALLENARKAIKNSTAMPKNIHELRDAVDKGMLSFVPWCKRTACEEEIKNKTSGAKTINMPFDQDAITETCIGCGQKAETLVYIAKSY